MVLRFVIELVFGSFWGESQDFRHVLTLKVPTERNSQFLYMQL